MAQDVFTIGHSTRTWEDFRNLLRAPVPGFHRAQRFAVFERSRSFFACADRSTANRR